MYCEFFGLSEPPFELTPNPKFLVLTPAHREALSTLEYGIASRKGITLLLGEAGTGKTTVIRTAIERQPHRVHCVHLHNPALTREEFLAMLAVQFELHGDARTSKAELLLQLDALLRERHARGETTVLLVDEAQAIPLELLEELRLLANVETDETKLLSVILAGQPELADRLNDPGLRQFKQRIALRCELRPLTLAETLGCIAGRLRAVGGVGARVFSRDAVTLIHERAKGIPRTVCVIADNALVTAFAAGQKPVTARIVQEVCHDLDLEPAEAPPAAVPAPPARSVLAFESADAETDGTALNERHDDAGSAPETPESTVEPAAAAAGSADANEDAAGFPDVARRRRRFSLF